MSDLQVSFKFLAQPEDIHINRLYLARASNPGSSAAIRIFFIRLFLQVTVQQSQQEVDSGVWFSAEVHCDHDSEKDTDGQHAAPKHTNTLCMERHSIFRMPRDCYEKMTVRLSLDETSAPGGHGSPGTPDAWGKETNS